MYKSRSVHSEGRQRAGLMSGKLTRDPKKDWLIIGISLVREEK